MSFIPCSSDLLARIFIFKLTFFHVISARARCVSAAVWPSSVIIQFLSVIKNIILIS
jgi:hypothetical protein